MPTMRAHLRSSDSVDFEHTETMKDIEELTYAEKRYVSPKDDLPVSFSHTYPGISTDRMPRETTTSASISRSNSKASFTSTTSEKIAVFRDGGDDVLPLMSKSKGRQSSRSIKNTVTEDVVSMPYQSRSIISSAYGEDEPNVVSGTTHLARQLRHIAGKRAALLQQLGDLQDEEKAVLAQLMYLKPFSSFGHPSRLEVDATAAAFPRRALEAPLLPMPTASRITSNLPSESAQRPSHSRTTSAPVLTTPSGPRHMAPSQAKRIPLGDKTEELLVTTDVTTQHVRNSPFFPATRVLQTGHTAVAMALNDSRKAASRIPTKFGDDSTPSKARQVTPIRKSRAVPGRGATRSRSGSKSRSRSKDRRPTTPGLAKSHEVVHTVARKKWDF